MNAALTQYLDKCRQQWDSIPAKRKEKLRTIADYIRKKREHGDQARLTFICTHNSRRSHFCQIWAAVSARYINREVIETYSGGTEATAFNPRAVAAIERAGFRVKNPDKGEKNPRYQVFYDEDADPLICYSKTFDDPANPQENFAAVMTCSHADENCPFVPGAEFRMAIPFDDPKESDGTEQEKEIYDERCLQIATQMLFMIAQLD